MKTTKRNLSAGFKSVFSKDVKTYGAHIQRPVKIVPLRASYNSDDTGNQIIYSNIKKDYGNLKTTKASTNKPNWNMNINHF